MVQGPLRPRFRLFMNDIAPSAHVSAAQSRGFAHVHTWIFDLDNTLYPHEARVWPQVDERITLYIMQLFGLDGLSARGLQKYFYHRYGTTLRGLIEEYGINPYDFLDFAHDIDHSEIALDESLGRAIERLPGRKLILTNGSRKHAENVARKIGILDHFEDVFDIAASDFVPKPDRRAYERGRELGAGAAPVGGREAALLVLEDNGFEPRVEDGGIALANCPFHVLARQYTELVCGMNLRLVSGVLDGVGSPGLVARLRPTSGMCCVRLDDGSA